MENKGSLSIGNPIAESTHLNKSSKFPWGGKVHPVQYSKSSNTTKVSPINNKSIIDPRIYTDIHSKGLASRIVKYHDDSLKLNRSLSAGSLYNKPGQFPIVHLNKNQIQYKANRSRPASVVRIAPPDKAVFQVNTRSSILRTPSIVPTVNLRKTNSELLCENRPILHPADNDLMPTRSVLDALKEISRKRINSDDLDRNDVIKKYCKESEDISRNISGNNDNSYNLPSSNSFTMKRQREIQQLSPNSQFPNSISEQAVKKRMFTSNNDITSSLSSSIHMITPKRKLGDIKNSSSTTISPTSDNSISPKTKQPCNERHNNQQQQQSQPRDNKLNLNVSHPCSLNDSINQITPLPPTPNVEECIRSTKSHKILPKI